MQALSIPRTAERGYMPPRGFDGKGIKPLSLPTITMDDVRDLSAIGIDMAPADLHDMVMAAHRHASRAGMAMDADLQPTITTGTVPTLIQFLQNWLPGFVNVITQARKIDDLIGMVTSGAWDDEEVVQGVLELTGTAVPYGDLTNVPLSSWNVEFNTRTNVRFEEGFRVGRLEEARSARIRVNSSQNKRDSAALALEINRNKVGFYGYNDGLGRTYGLLNDPGLPSAVQLPPGSSGSRSWADKNFYEITSDLRFMASSLRLSSGDTIDPMTTPITLALPVSQVDYLSVTATNGSGESVREWLDKTYGWRITSAPELDNAVGGVDVAYIYADSINDTSTDDKRVWIQVISSKFHLLGVQQMAKGYEEDYSNATAGVMLKRPYAVGRYLFG